MTMIAADLMAWRMSHDLTLDQLAASLEVNRMTVWKWEKGHHPIPHMVELALWAIDHGALVGETVR
jgi:DNA-binding XRE family transcriptional regulator